MPSDATIDDSLASRLPLPLAQLYRRAHNAKTPLERHLTGFYLWEAGLKLLACASAAAARSLPANTELGERAQIPARPSLGQWWEFARRLLPAMSDADAAGFAQLRDELLGKARGDLPRCAGLDAVLREALEGKSGARSTVRISEMFDRLVRLRNEELGHGAAGQRPSSFYERTGPALVAGMGELFTSIDVLAGRRLLFVADVRRLGNGAWLVERFELRGPLARRLESREVEEPAADSLPRPGQLYITDPVASVAGDCLHPLMLYDPESERVSFFNSQRDERRSDYLCYTTGAITHVESGESSGALQAPMGSTTQSEDQPADRLPGSKYVGEFELLSRLGAGGMGVVYRAWQPSLGRQVALKCLMRSGDPKAESRFGREIRALGRVEHPNLVKVFTSGADGDQWYYAMELLEGADLAAICERLAQYAATEGAGRDWNAAVSTVCEEQHKREEPLTATDLPQAQPSAAPTITIDDRPSHRGHVAHVVDVVRQVAQAAHALHEAGIIHRDIKPGNIMIDPAGEHAVLMDLGLAQIADDVDGRLTKTRQFVGTLRYASPEQVRNAPLDRRADVYSLGATLWELLTLRPLFDATDHVETAEVMRRISIDEPRRVRACNPSVGRDLEAVVHRCLEKDPARRYASAQEFGDELARWQRGEPVRARSVGQVERGWKWVRRRPLLAGLTGALAAALVVGTIVSWVFAVRAGREEVKARDAASREADRANEAQQNAVEARRHADEERKAKEEFAAALAISNIRAAQAQWRDGKAAHARALLDSVPAEHREWEWRHLRREYEGSYQTLYGHTDSVNGLAVNSDGTRLYSAGVDATIRAWDVASGRELATHRLSGSGISSIALSPRGDRLAVTCHDGVVRVCDAASGRELLELRGHAGEVSCAAFSHDGERIASGGSDGTIRIWNAATAKEENVLRGHKGNVVAVAFSPHGARLASGGIDGGVRTWDLSNGQQLAIVQAFLYGPNSIAFHPDGKYLASCTIKGMQLSDVESGAAPFELPTNLGGAIAVAFDAKGTRLAECSSLGIVRVWDVPARKSMADFYGHDGSINAVAFLPDGQRLVSAGQDCSIRAWDMRLDPKKVLLGHVGEVSAVAFSRDSRALASCCLRGAIRTWDVEDGRSHSANTDRTESKWGVAYSPDGELLACGGDDGYIRLFSVRDGKEVHAIEAKNQGVRGIAFSPDGKRIAGGARDGTVRVWDSASGRELALFRTGISESFSVAFSPNGKQLAAGGIDQLVHVWDLESNRGSAAYRLQTPIASVAYSPDGNRLAAACWDGIVRVLDATDGRELLSLRGHRTWAAGVAFSPNGKRIASAGWDGTIRIWDSHTGHEVAVLPGHSRVHCVKFSPDGFALASGGTDFAVRIWDAHPPRPVVELRGQTGWMSALAFDATGERVAGGGNDGTVRVWNARTGQELAVFRGHSAQVVDVAFGSDGRWYSKDDAGTSVSWDESGKNPQAAKWTFPARRGVGAVSPDGQRLALPRPVGGAIVVDTKPGSP